MKLKNKSDILYLIMGTNPFPNLISAITRIKPEGKIVCICTNETRGDPYRRFKKVVEKNINSIKIDYLVVDGFEMEGIKEDIEEDLRNKLYEVDGKLIIELNYTGGTKIMSTSAYETFRNYNYNKHGNKINVVLSYIDSEREIMCYELRKGYNNDFVNGSIKLQDITTEYGYTVFDIINAYNFPLKNESKVTKEVKRKDIAVAIANLFCKIDKVTYDKHIKFIREVNRIIYEIKYNNKDYNLKVKEFKCKMDCLLKKYSLPLKYKRCDDFQFETDEKLYKYFIEGKWMEEYVFSIFLDLKNQGILDDTIANYEKKSYDEESEFEVDIVAYRKYKLFAISITSSSKEKYVRGKLYEIKQRAKDLGGDEAGMCYINLCWENNRLKEKILNIWEEPKPQNMMIIDAKHFGKLKEKLKCWITGDEYIEG